jgi:hypothetical protein
MRFFYLMAVLLALPGCIDSVIEEATATQYNPGGTVLATMALGAVSGTQRTTPALAKYTAEPMTIQGSSAQLTFSLTAADSLGGTAITDLVAIGDTSTLTLYPTGRNQLEVHLDGDGCLAPSATGSGTIHLSLDEKMHIDGSFDVQGNTTSAGDTCHITGTLADIPTEH